MNISIHTHLELLSRSLADWALYLAKPDTSSGPPSFRTPSPLNISVLCFLVIVRSSICVLFLNPTDFVGVSEFLEDEISPFLAALISLFLSFTRRCRAPFPAYVIIENFQERL